VSIRWLLYAIFRPNEPSNLAISRSMRYPDGILTRPSLDEVSMVR
jgi:hypothetical protein